MKKDEEEERISLIQTLDNVLEGPIIFLGFVWLLLISAELIWGLNPVLEYVSYAIWGVFIVDFLIKFILAPHKLKFFKTNWLTAISLIIPAIRLFRVLRVLRLIRGVRLIRVVSSLNRSMKSLASTMQRRGFAYVLLLTIAVVFGGAAGMFAIERGNQGFETYGLALWWTAMRVITSGSDFWPLTGEGRGLAFILALYGYAIFGYVTATLATFFIGRDAEDRSAPIAGAEDVQELKRMVAQLSKKLDDSAK